MKQFEVMQIFVIHQTKTIPPVSTFLAKSIYLPNIFLVNTYFSLLNLTSCYVVCNHHTYQHVCKLNSHIYTLSLLMCVCMLVCINVCMYMYIRNVIIHMYVYVYASTAWMFTSQCVCIYCTLPLKCNVTHAHVCVYV